VIDGKRFSTKTAEHVGEIANRDNGFGDFLNERTDLYRTRNGQFFIAGEGGGATRWRRLATDGGGWNPGSGLELLSEPEAQKLMEDHDLDVEAFFDVVEG
jgi:hypothetical protein